VTSWRTHVQYNFFLIIVTATEYWFTSRKEFKTEEIFKITRKDNIIFLQIMLMLFCNMRGSNLVRNVPQLWRNVLPSITQRWRQNFAPNRPIHHYLAMWQQFSPLEPWKLQALHFCAAFGPRVISEIIYWSYLYKKIHFRLICIIKIGLLRILVFYIIKVMDVIQWKAFC
jgi:hypothetical protein